MTCLPEALAQAVQRAYANGQLSIRPLAVVPVSRKYRPNKDTPTAIKFRADKARKREWLAAHPEASEKDWRKIKLKEWKAGRKR